MDDIIELIVPEVNNLSIEQLKAKIDQLAQTEDGEPLAGAMADLKKALKENPAACSLLLEEDVGKMVQSLYRLTNKAIMDDLTTGKKKEGSVSKNKMPSKEDLDNITMDDLM